MKNVPKTAIVVLSYNGIDITKKFLCDLYNNTEDFMLIMIDNASTDGTSEFLDKFSYEHENVIYVANGYNKAIIGGRNQGYDILCSLKDPPSYMMFLDNDQFVQKDWLLHHYDVMNSYNYDVIGVEAWTMNSSFFPFRQCISINHSFSYVGCGGMLMKKEVPDTIGLFDINFNPCYFEDPDFCYRLRKSGYKLGWNCKARIIHLPHQTLGKNKDSMLHFRRSHAYFKRKWKNTRMCALSMVDMPQFHENYVCKK